MPPPLTDPEALAAAKSLRLVRPEAVLDPKHATMRRVVELAHAALQRIHAERAVKAEHCAKNRAAGLH